MVGTVMASTTNHISNLANGVVALYASRMGIYACGRDGVWVQWSTVDEMTIKRAFDSARPAVDLGPKSGPEIE